MTIDSDEFQFKSLEFVRIKKKHNLSVKLTLIIISFILLLFLILPWQQTIIGHGKVTVFSPMDRPQKISSQIDAVIKKWMVNEGQHVKKGDVLLELEEINSLFLDKNQLEKLKNKKQALIRKQQAINESILVLTNQIESLSTLPYTIKESQNLIINQQNDSLTASKKALQTTKLNLARIQSLFQEGLRSKRDLELAELEFATKKAELDIAKRNFDIAELTRNQILAETDAKIQSARSGMANSKEQLAAVDADIIKLDIDISNLEIRKSQRIIKSPINGQITRLHVIGRMEAVKAGEDLAVIVPDIVDQAVELYVDDYNAPLMKEGRHVRIMFSGWPAVQFSGWPFLSVGTFGGVIAAVDAVDNGNNRFRVIIKPDQKRIAEGHDVAWPKYPILKPGTQAHGWILLDVVTVAFEIWRQFNGFPPSLLDYADGQKNLGASDR